MAEHRRDLRVSAHQRGAVAQLRLHQGEGEVHFADEIDLLALAAGKTGAVAHRLEDVAHVLQAPAQLVDALGQGARVLGQHLDVEPESVERIRQLVRQSARERSEVEQSEVPRELGAGLVLAVAQPIGQRRARHAHHRHAGEVGRRHRERHPIHGRDAGLRRRRAAHLQHRPRRRPSAHHTAHQGGHSRAPVRAVLRHGRDYEHSA